ncbi:MAG: nitrilase family protein [Crocinitomicaceae bacterium]|nr:nitrilase family protein [Crocinitomicaceae bacterium]
MQDLRITFVQFDQSWENIEANVSKVSQFMDSIEDCDLIVLPEMFHTSFSMNVALAEEWIDNPILANLCAWSKQKQAAIYTSMMVKENSSFFNRGVFVQPNGHVSSYDKRKAFGLGGEDLVFSPGIQETIVEYLGWKFNLQICYDLRFPELIRNRLDENGLPAYDVLLYVANWPQKRVTHWTTLLQARAIENQCYALGVNRVGIDGMDLHYSGSSAAYDGLGQTIVAMNDQEGLASFALKQQDLIDLRRSLPFLKDRK